MVVDNWFPIVSMRAMKYFIDDYFKQKLRVHQLYFIGALPQANVKHRCFGEVGQQIWIILLRILQLFWKTIKTEEVNVWHE